ncbi:MAG: NAD(P)-dependent oxidoreductase, partial [Actinomycetia bacterium]|nr:NAD(P)-dependent oxidoreductase [Actinomycetes bacterium]
SSDTFTAHRDVVNLFGSARYLGEDAGMAALQDLAMLAAMYAMFAGAYHAFAMVSSVGVEATDFAGPLGGWLRAMTASLPGAAALIDAGDFSTDVQDLEFTRMALDTIIQATDEAGVGSDVLEPVRAMVERQIIAGHGDDHFNRMIESIRTQ